MAWSKKTPKKPRKLAAEELFEYAVKALAARGYSSGDLRNKLRLRAVDLADIDATIDRLREIGYLNDQRFAESYASARLANEGFGRMRILTDLRAHRISGELADGAVELALEGKPEAELIDAYIERRMPSLTGPDPAAPDRKKEEKKLATAYRRLRRAGFSSGATLAALKKKTASPELVEEFPEEEETETEV
jgi:regulatory protein